jgi:hypothetical protein
MAISDMASSPLITSRRKMSSSSVVMLDMCATPRGRHGAASSHSAPAAYRCSDVRETPIKA